MLSWLVETESDEVHRAKLLADDRVGCIMYSMHNVLHVALTALHDGYRGGRG